MRIHFSFGLRAAMLPLCFSPELFGHLRMCAFLLDCVQPCCRFALILHCWAKRCLLFSSDIFPQVQPARSEHRRAQIAVLVNVHNLDIEPTAGHAAQLGRDKIAKPCRNCKKKLIARPPSSKHLP